MSFLKKNKSALSEGLWFLWRIKDVQLSIWKVKRGTLIKVFKIELALATEESIGGGISRNKGKIICADIVLRKRWDKHDS